MSQVLQDRLEGLRQAGWTARGLAKALDVDVMTIYRWENGAPPVYEQVTLLALTELSRRIPPPHRKAGRPKKA